MLRNSGLLIKFNVAVMVVKLKCCESRGPRLLLFWWLNMLRNSVLLMFINVAVLVVKCCEGQDCLIMLLFWWLNVTKAEMDYYMLLFWWLNVAKLGIVN